MRLAHHLLCLLVAQGMDCVHIERIAGPEVVRAGSDLMLDCNFSYLAEEESQLDLKWYFNGSPVPVYQWVPSMNKGPQVIGDLFRHKLDLQYTAHNDTYKKHRALRIVNSDHRFSGTYQCKVSSFVDEDFQQKEVLVYAPPSSTQIVPLVTPSDPDHLNVSCLVEGVYPVPRIDLSWTNNSTTEYMARLDTVVRTAQSGLLDVTVSSKVSRLDFTPDVVIACDVTIESADFYVREELQLFKHPRLKSRYTSGEIRLLPQLLPLLLLLASQFL